MTFTQLSNQETYLTIHEDGRIEVSENLQPSETAALVLECMRTKWMADAQSIKIRDQQERIKRLEDTISRAAFTFFRDGSDRKTSIRMLEILDEERKP